ncbi:MAG: bifunctional tetrahydrofolate synthase/dihydrofolate synthase [Gammaproteobacteria bacterium]
MAVRFDNLHDWLSWQETLHVAAIDLGLARVGEVARRLRLTDPGHTVITIAGTNGKGSCAAFMEHILSAAGYRVGCYTSPHLLRYNERVRIHQEQVADELLCQSFARIDESREDITLSFFEFGTLAAMDIFERGEIDVAIMEVGLGGRLDAVNIQDPHLGLITRIGIDHTDWLGDDRESIGREKAGIMRKGRPVVCGDPDPPESVLAWARACGARLYRVGVDFDFSRGAHDWGWQGGPVGFEKLPLPALPGDVQFINAATVLMGLSLLAGTLAVDETAIRQGLQRVTLPGRFQRKRGRIETVFDVAHNRDSAEELARSLRKWPVQGRNLAVFSALKHKDVEGMVASLGDVIDRWYVAPVDADRGLAIDELTSRMERLIDAARLEQFRSVPEAYQAVLRDAGQDDRAVVCGSFHTVAEVMTALET